MNQSELLIHMQQDAYLYPLKLITVKIKYTKEDKETKLVEKGEKIWLKAGLNHLKPLFGTGYIHW